MVVIKHRTFTVKSTRNTSTAWISCRNTDTDADPREPKQLKDRRDGTIRIYTRGPRDLTRLIRRLWSSASSSAEGAVVRAAK